MRHERALIGEIVELHRHTLAVRFVQPETQRAERRRQKRGVELALSSGRRQQPWSNRYCSMKSPVMSALASSMAL